MISFRIPKPISTNNLYRNVPNLGRLTTVKYKKWKTEAGWAIRAQLVPLPRVTGPFCLSIWLPTGIDLDNGAKGITDLLGPSAKGSLGITDDDRHMAELHIYRHTDADCRVEVSAASQS